jgi:hypothetical protein
MTLQHLLNQLIIFVKHVLDATAAFITIGALVEYLPPAAAALSMVWMCLQIFTWARRKGWQTDAEKAREGQQQ